MSPAPKTNHQLLVTELLFAIRSSLSHKQCKVFAAPFDVRLPLSSEVQADQTENVVQPDLCVICDLSKLDDRGCNGAPDLVVEIVSKSSVKKDLHEKYDLYQQAGVKEYWIVYPNDLAVSVYTLDEEGNYQLYKPYTIGDKIVSKVFPGLEIDVEKTYGDIVNEPDPPPYGENLKRI